MIDLRILAAVCALALAMESGPFGRAFAAEIAGAA